MNHSSLVGKLFLNRYLVGSCIGFGSFGHVYLVYDIVAELIYAMKSVIFLLFLVSIKNKESSTD